MSVCEFHPSYRKHFEGDYPTALNVQDELQWATAYRSHKKIEKDRAGIPVKRSPVDIPFKICREKQRVKKKKKPKKGKKPKQPTLKKLSLLEKSVLSQDKYMKYLSTPKPKYEKTPKRERKPPCQLEPCPPRLVQLAVPNKRRVFANWKDYYKLLPPEMLMRFEQILHTEKSLEPRDARYYYKKLDKMKRKKLKEKKKLRKQRRDEKQANKKWLQEEIRLTIKAILTFIAEEPLFMLNYKQLLLSEAILEQLDQKGVLKKPARTTRRPYKQTIINLSDKMAIWIDTLIRFVDIQAIDSKEDIAPISLDISVKEEEESEPSEYFSESESESSLEEESEIDEYLFKQGFEGEFGEEFEGEFGQGIEGLMPTVRSGFEVDKNRISPIWELDENEDEEGFLDGYFSQLDIDQLNKLIEILGNCSPEFLAQPIDPDKALGATYGDILKKLTEMRDAMVEQEPKPTFLEDLMIEWAKRNDPDKVDDKLIDKIRETAPILDEWLKCREEKGKGGDKVDWTYSGSNLEIDQPKGSATPLSSQHDQQGTVSGQVSGLLAGTESTLLDEEASGIVSGEESGIISGKASSAMSGGIISAISGEESGTIAGEISGGISGEASGVIPSEFSGASGLIEGTVSGMVSGEMSAEFSGADFGEGSKTWEIEDKEKSKADVDVLHPEEVEEGIPGVIKGHKPPRVFEHSPDKICCLSLKIWAVWLMEITHNAHSWTKWVYGLIKRVREFASIVRGDVVLADGSKKVLPKSDWRKFVKETEEKVITWRAYSQHVRDLTDEIIDNYHGKKVNCCPKCLQDQLIKDVVHAHDTLRALTEAMNCASYWQRCLDSLVETGAEITTLDEKQEIESSSSGSIEIEGLVACICKTFKKPQEEESGESVYEIEEININHDPEDDQGSPGTSNRARRGCQPRPGAYCRKF